MRAPSETLRRAVAAALLLLAAVVGCEPQANRQPAEPVALTPEERFESLVSALKRHVEDQTLGNAAAAAAYDAPLGTPITSARIRVKDELLPPPPAGDEPRRARVCFVAKTKLTVVLAQPDAAESEADGETQNREIAEMSEELSGVADLESLVVPTPEQAAARLGTSTGSTFELAPDEDTRCFDLEFRDDRWELVSETDPENEPFYTLAIEYALRRQ